MQALLGAGRVETLFAGPGALFQDAADEIVLKVVTGVVKDLKPAAVIPNRGGLALDSSIAWFEPED